MVTFKDYNNTINEGWAVEILKFADPTGILSIPDLVRAIGDYVNDRTVWKLIWLILCILAVLPVLKYIGKSLMGGLKLIKAGKASPKIVMGVEKSLSKAVNGILKNQSKITNLLTKAKIPKASINIVFSGLKSFKSSSFLKSVTTAAKGIEQTVRTSSLRGSLGTAYTARAVKGLGYTGKEAASEVKQKLEPYKIPPGERLTSGGYTPTAATQTAQASTETQQEPEELLTYTDPRTGRQFQGTASELRSVGLLPIENPPQQSYPFSNTGIQLTPAQQQAIGGFIPRGGAQRTGQMIPQNVPQGATQQNPFGREGMSPSEYMTPDNFNNPPYQQYQIPNQQQNYNNQQYGLGNLVGDVGNTVAGTVGGIGAMAGQLAATPIAGLTNLASGLLGLIPGIGGTTGLGNQPQQQYYRSPVSYNPYNYEPYGAQR